MRQRKYGKAAKIRKTLVDFEQFAVHFTFFAQNMLSIDGSYCHQACRTYRQACRSDKSISPIPITLEESASIQVKRCIGQCPKFLNFGDLLV
jgi:hypothetical protein